MGQVSDISGLPLFSTTVLLGGGVLCKEHVLGAREYVLGVTDPLSSPGRIWASCHHSFVVGGMSPASVLLFCC